MNQTKFSLEKVTTVQMIGLMLLAYIFSFSIRLIWVFQFQDNPNFIWENQLMINTNDGYFFASGVQEALSNLHTDNPRVPDLWRYGTVFFTYLFVSLTPMSLETTILYMPAIISSVVVIPVILIARLYKQTLWGFFAALLGSIAWSYYNRTMVGYYDTDMFSAMAPMFILFFLMKSTIDFNLKSGLYASLAIAIYPFLYDGGLSIVYAMGLMYGLYMLFYHHKDKLTYLSLISVFVALLPFPLVAPYSYLLKIIVLLILYFTLIKNTLSEEYLIIITGIIFLLFLFFGNMFGLIFAKVSNYLATGTKSEGLHFYSVAQTVREAGQIPFKTFANRISGSGLGVILSFIGYILLVLRHRAFILALPLIGIGGFALLGGLRFTVYAVPIAAMSGIYLFFILGDFFKNKVFKYTFIVIATIAMIIPNIIHIIGYKVPTVLNNTEVKDLVKLNTISSPKDYTLTWWDYGYPIWYYSDTSTLIDGGKHNNDNFLISKIMQTTSPQLAANLSRLSVETYIDSNYSIVANKLFKSSKEVSIDPNLLLLELEDSTYKTPSKSRDIYLYLPYRMLNIFPTVAVFGNLDLHTGKELRDIVFYPSSVASNKAGVIRFSNGIVFDTRKGEVVLGRKTGGVKYFVTTQNTASGDILIQSQVLKMDAEYSVIYMKSYGKFVIMDNETFNSMYVQMFILGKYDKNLFELVVSSNYSKIYKLKK